MNPAAGASGAPSQTDAPPPPNPRDSAIYPTPTIGVVGLLEDVSQVLTRSFRELGDEVVLLGACTGELGGSEYLKTVHGRVAGRPPRLDLEAEGKLYRCVLEANAAGLLRSAHDCSDGGLAVALAESCFAGDEPGLGAELCLPASTLRPDALLFGEAPSRMVTTTPDAGALGAMAARHGVPCTRLGTVVGGRLVVTIDGAPAIDFPVARLHEAWTSLERLLG